MSKVFLREAEMSDLELLFSWVNEKSVRENAFNTHVITLEEHAAWFHRMMDDPDQIQLIMMVQESPVGQIRFSVEDNEADIDYSISQQYRGSGYGKEIVQLGIKMISRIRPEIRKLVGKVKPSNPVSIKCFLDNKFKEEYVALEYDMGNGECSK